MPINLIFIKSEIHGHGMLHFFVSKYAVLEGYQLKKYFLGVYVHVSAFGSSMKLLSVSALAKSLSFVYVYFYETSCEKKWIINNQYLKKKKQ